MKFSHALAINILVAISYSTLFSMQQHPRTIEKRLDALQKALSSNKLRDIVRAGEILKVLRCNRNLACVNGKPLAHFATRREAVDLLNTYGTDFTIKDSAGNSALHNSKNSATTLALLATGIDSNALNKHGQTPLFFAKSARQVAILVQLGADVNAVDFFGRTPLYYAQNSAVAKELIKHGASLDIEDEYGKTPGQYLAEINPEASFEIEQFLNHQTEKKQARHQQIEQKQNVFVWRAKPKPATPAHVIEMKEPEEDPLYTFHVLEQMATENLQEQTIQNSTPIVSPEPETPILEHKLTEQLATEKTQSVDQNPLNTFAQDNRFAILHNDEDDTTELVLINDVPTSKTIEQKPAGHAKKDKSKHTNHLVIKIPVRSSTLPSAQPTPTIKQQDSTVPTPVVSAPVTHNSTPIMSPKPVTMFIEHKEPVTSASVLTQQSPVQTQPATVAPNTTSSEYFNPLAGANYYEVLEVKTPELDSLPRNEWVDIKEESKL
jgi:hypothetical protein